MNRIKELTLSPITYLRDIDTAHNTEANAFEAGKKAQLEHNQRQICQLFPQPLDDEGLGEEIAKSIEGFIIINGFDLRYPQKANNNQSWFIGTDFARPLATKILALLQPKIEEATKKERERIKLQVEIELKSAGYGGIIVALNNTKTWQALKGGE